MLHWFYEPENNQVYYSNDISVVYVPYRSPHSGLFNTEIFWIFHNYVRPCLKMNIIGNYLDFKKSGFYFD